MGGNERLGSTGLSVALLNRGSRRCRRNLFADLAKTGFDLVVSIESPPAAYDIEDLSREFPFVRFVLLKESASLGEQINLAASEIDTPLFFTLWSDLRFITGGGARRMADRLRRTVLDQDGKRETSARLCTVPLMQGPRFDTLPTLRMPVMLQKKEQTRGAVFSQEGLRTLYPVEGVGIYDKELFVGMGGFDWTIKSPYWQLMDFGFRAHLWGEEIAVTRSVKLAYEMDPIPEDTTSGDDYRRFYLKNLAPAFRKDCAHLPLLKFPGYLFQAARQFKGACKDFSEGRRWVHTNRYRWRRDPRTIFSLWNHSGAEEDFPALGQETSA